jgi:hypothetical protein
LTVGDDHLVAYRREAFHLGAYPDEVVNRRVAFHLGAYRLEAFLSEVVDFLEVAPGSTEDLRDVIVVRGFLGFEEAAYCCFVEEVLGSIK